MGLLPGTPVLLETGVASGIGCFSMDKVQLAEHGSVHGFTDSDGWTLQMCELKCP
jgi:hypothetical protein